MHCTVFAHVGAQVGFIDPQDALDFRFQIRSVNHPGVAQLVKSITEQGYAPVRASLPWMGPFFAWEWM